MSKQLAIIYYSPGSEAAAKDIANRIRNEGHLANLTTAVRFKGVGNLRNCASVAIQNDSARAELIAATYRKAAPETEIHFFDTAGNWVDEDAAPVDPEPETPPEGTTADANADAEQADPDVTEEEADAVAEGDPEVADDAQPEAGNDAGEEVTQP